MYGLNGGAQMKRLFLVMAVLILTCGCSTRNGLLVRAVATKYGPSVKVTENRKVEQVRPVPTVSGKPATKTVRVPTELEQVLIEAQLRQKATRDHGRRRY